MKEQPDQRKQILYYCGIVLLITLLLNIFVFPLLLQPQVTEVTYDQFLTMVEEGRVTRGGYQDSMLVFIGKNDEGRDAYYKTGVWPWDEALTDKLLEKNVYKYEKDRLVYKEFLLTLSDFDFVAGEDPRGEKLLEADGDCDLTFCFDGSVLKSFSYTSPRLLYSGLDSNVDEEELQNMDEEKMGAVMKVRGDILTSLREAFRNAGIESEIDETTGEIAMDSKVLFDINSYELSDEGKAYLDQFMKAYIPVLFSDEFRDSIAHVDFEGHTDSVGSFGFNMELSQNRADAVRDYCLESSENGLDADQKALLKEKAVTRGFAGTDLVYDENGKEDRDASRRVLIMDGCDGGKRMYFACPDSPVFGKNLPATATRTYLKDTSRD